MYACIFEFKSIFLDDSSLEALGSPQLTPMVTARVPAALDVIKKLMFDAVASEDQMAADFVSFNVTLRFSGI